MGGERRCFELHSSARCVPPLPATAALRPQTRRTTRAHTHACTFAMFCVVLWGVGRCHVPWDEL